jgi:Flp pilus assembly protein TadD
VDPAATIDLVRRLLREGRVVAAREQIAESLAEQPDNSALQAMLAMLHCHAGAFSQARTLMEAVLAREPRNATAHLVLGTAHFGSGNRDRARLELEKALELDPVLHEAHYNLAQVCLSADPPDTEGARRHYRLSIELGGPRDPDLETSLGQ